MYDKVLNAAQEWVNDRYYDEGRIKDGDLLQFVKTGGMRGGDCWGNKAEPYTEKVDPKCEYVSYICRRVCPKISFLDYEELQELISTYNKSIEDYYGNCTDYIVYEMNLEKLARALEEMGYE